MKQLFLISLSFLLSTFFFNQLQAQTNPICNPENCPKICQVICGKTAAVKATGASCKSEVKATTVALNSSPAEKTATCRKICAPQSCRKSVKASNETAVDWAVAVGLPAMVQKAVAGKSSCSKPCTKVKAKEQSQAAAF